MEERKKQHAKKMNDFVTKKGNELKDQIMDIANSELRKIKRIEENRKAE